MGRIFLVVPTIREECIVPFLEAWGKGGLWDGIVIVEDNPSPSFDISKKAFYHHYCWQDVDKDFGDSSWIISRRDSGIKCYGFLKAYQLGADYIFCLDDDCYPLEKPEDFISQHIANLEETPRWTESILGQRTRGIPYQNKGVLDTVVFSHGLWANVPDFDAIQSLSNPPGYFQPPTYTWVWPKHQFMPFCGMNFAFKRKVAPLCYFPFMGTNSPYRRFDDIWFGIIAKKICDHLGYHIVSGRPFVDHRKASNVFANLEKEAPGIVANEVFWERIDNICLREKTPTDCMLEIAEVISDGTTSRPFDDYLSKLGKAIKLWVKAIRGGYVS